MVRIFLTGYMGAGKTTLGKAFARQMDIPFVDLDWYIEERFHKTVGELFTERGETGFRKLERNMLHEVAEFENVVISTGGGAPCFFDNMEFMNGPERRFFSMCIRMCCSDACVWLNSNALFFRGKRMTN